MSAPITDLLDAGTVSGIAEEVWSAMVGADEQLVALPVAAPHDPVSAWVEVVGPWRGAVVLTCGRPTAETLAAAVLRLDDDEEPTAEDVADVLGELANVLGGNVKSLLPGPSALGLPVLGVPPYPAAGPGDSCLVDATWRGHPLSITVQGARTAPAPHTTEVPL